MSRMFLQTVLSAVILSAVLTVLLFSPSAFAARRKSAKKIPVIYDSDIGDDIDRNKLPDIGLDSGKTVQGAKRRADPRRQRQDLADQAAEIGQ